MNSLQEKFQITVPAKVEVGGGWASQGSERDLRGSKEWCSESAGDVDMTPFNRMPPGMDSSNQCDTQQFNMPMSLAGATDASNGVNATSLGSGYAKLAMKGTDDQYAGKHVDHFYGDAGGFVDRNNYLDR